MIYMYMRYHWTYCVDDVFCSSVYKISYFFDSISAYFKYTEGRVHVLPGDIEMLLLDRHVFMESKHIRASVVIRSTEEVG